MRTHEPTRKNAQALGAVASASPQTNDPLSVPRTYRPRTGGGTGASSAKSSQSSRSPAPGACGRGKLLTRMLQPSGRLPGRLVGTRN